MAPTSSGNALLLAALALAFAAAVARGQAPPEREPERWGDPTTGVTSVVPDGWVTAFGARGPSVIERDGDGIRCSATLLHEPIDAAEPPSLEALLERHRRLVSKHPNLEGATFHVAEVRLREVDGLAYYVLEFSGVAAGGFRMRFRTVGFVHAGRLVRLETQVEESGWERSVRAQDSLLEGLLLAEPRAAVPDRRPVERDRRRGRKRDQDR